MKNERIRKAEIELSEEEWHTMSSYCLLRTYKLAKEVIEKLSMNIELPWDLENHSSVAIEDLEDTMHIVESVRNKIVEAVRKSETGIHH